MNISIVEENKAEDCRQEAIPEKKSLKNSKLLANEKKTKLKNSQRKNEKKTFGEKQSSDLKETEKMWLDFVECVQENPFLSLVEIGKKLKEKGYSQISPKIIGQYKKKLSSQWMKSQQKPAYDYVLDQTEIFQWRLSQFYQTRGRVYQIEKNLYQQLIEQKQWDDPKWMNAYKYIIECLIDVEKSLVHWKNENKLTQNILEQAFQIINQQE